MAGTTMTVLDGLGASKTAQLITAPGTQLDADSSPVAFSTEGKAQLALINTTAVAMSAKLPATLGNTTKAASLGTALATDDLLVTAFGAQADAQAAADNSTASLISLVKKNNANLTTLNTSVNASNAQLPTTIGPAAKAAALVTTGATDDPAALGIGGTADAAATAGSTGSISAKLRTLTGQLPPTSGGSLQLTITRPANATPYTAGDCIGAAAAALTFATGMTSGQRVMIAGVDFEYDVAALPAAMTTCRLYLYSVTPPSAFADNGAWDLPSGDRASFLGYVDLGQLVDLGSTLFVQTDNVNKAIQLSGSANVFAYLVTNAGFTPAGNSEVLRVRLQFLGL